MPSPVLPGEPTVQSVLTGARWYCLRISAFRSKPPVASSTPLLARISAGWPSRLTCTPMTRPSAISRPVIGVFSQTGTSSCSRPALIPAASDWPRLSSRRPVALLRNILPVTLAVVQMARQWLVPRLSQR